MEGWRREQAVNGYGARGGGSGAWGCVSGMVGYAGGDATRGQPVNKTAAVSPATMRRLDLGFS